jgi:hypothetical protein
MIEDVRLVGYNYSFYLSLHMYVGQVDHNNEDGSDNRRVKHHGSSDAKSALASLELLVWKIFIREVGGILM